MGSPLPIDTSRLWLQMVTVTNQTASLVIHPPVGVSNQVYELLYSTNLLTPPTNWQWVLRSYPDATNLIVPNATNADGFYRLREPGDLVANDSLGTNFWLAFCGLPDSNDHLTLFISSSVGATGTVISPQLLTNGPIVIVTNCGDLALNGLYVLTNLNAVQQTAWAGAGISPDAPSYVRGTNWVIADPSQDYSFLAAYDDNAGSLTTLYSKSGANLNGTYNDWQNSADTNSPPATICPQVPVINQKFTLATGTGTNILIPMAAMGGDSQINYVDYNVIKVNGLNVVASQPVAVYGLDYDRYASTAFTACPTPMLGTNYCVMSRAANYPFYGGISEFAIVATTTNTTVEIFPSPTADFTLFDPYATDPIWITNLQPGETYQLRSEYTYDDVTGTQVTADKPIVVFAGTDLANVPDDSTESANPLMQQQLPVESWGKEVLAMSLAGRTNGDTYRVLAAYSNTVVTVTGKVITILQTNMPWVVTVTNETITNTIDAGQPFEIIVDGPVEFQATKPIQVAQFANGCYSDYIPDPDTSHPLGDPCEILLPPTGHWLQTNIVATLLNDLLNESFDENWLNIIVVQSAITNTFVNGISIPATKYVPIGTSGYFGTQLAITNKIYQVTSPAPISVEIYGFSYADAYGYFGGVVK